jgi:hypothetical protein
MIKMTGNQASWTKAKWQFVWRLVAMAQNASQLKRDMSNSVFSVSSDKSMCRQQAIRCGCIL